MGGDGAGVAITPSYNTPTANLTSYTITKAHFQDTYSYGQLKMVLQFLSVGTEEGV